MPPPPSTARLSAVRSRTRRRARRRISRTFAARSRLVAGQVRVDAKSNETAAMPKLFELLDAEGRIAAADAMHAQCSAAEEVTRRCGDCVPVPEGNRERTRDEVRFHFADPGNAEKMLLCKDLDKGGGRIETREATVCRDVQALRGLHHWPGLVAVGRAEATREIRGERETETRFLLPGSKMDPERFPETIRARRAVENSLRRAHGAAMNEDARRNRAGSGPESPAPAGRLAPDVAWAHPGQDSMRGKLKKAAWRNECPLDPVRSSVKAKEAKKS